MSSVKRPIGKGENRVEDRIIENVVPINLREETPPPVEEWSDEGFCDVSTLTRPDQRMMVIRVEGERIYYRSFHAPGSVTLTDILTIATLLGARVSESHDAMASRLDATVPQ